MKNLAKILAAIIIVIFIVSLTYSISSSITEKNILLRIYGENQDYMLLTDKDVGGNWPNAYGTFLDDEKARFIIECCESFSVDSNVVVSILEKENPCLIVDATSKPNLNGTRDVGLFQLNDRSLYSKDGFLDKYWDSSLGEFNADNWKHSTYIAVKFIGDLVKMFGDSNVYWIACAYNAGPSRAYKEWTKEDDKSYLPESTVNNYAPCVFQNYKKWEKINPKN